MNPYAVADPAFRLRDELAAANRRIAELEQELADERAKNIRLQAGLDRPIRPRPYWPYP